MGLPEMLELSGNIAFTNTKQKTNNNTKVAT